MGTTPLNLWVLLGDGPIPRGQGVLRSPHRPTDRNRLAGSGVFSEPPGGVLRTEAPDTLGPPYQGSDGRRARSRIRFLGPRDPHPLAALARTELDAAGGPLFDGYWADGRPVLAGG